MEVMITDPSQGVWRTPGESSVRRPLDCPFPWPCAPCASETCLAFGCLASHECMVIQKNTGQLLCQMPCVPGVCGMALSRCGRYLYQLSSEADCVHTRLTATGELLYAVPTGVFPRSMVMNASGQNLLVAGGAASEAYILTLPQLHKEAVVTTRHPCFAAGFFQKGLVLVCAVEGEDIHTAVYVLAWHSVRPRLLTQLPGQPGGLCVCPDGRQALLSTRDGLKKLDLQNGDLLWKLPEWALAMNLGCMGNLALISGAMDGRVALISHYTPWMQRELACGTATEACFCV